MSGFKETIILALPMVFVGVACWVIPFPSNIYMLLAIGVSIFLLMIPVFGSVYQVGIMGVGLYFVITEAYPIYFLVLYGLLFLLCLGMNGALLKNHIDLMRSK